MIDSLLPLLAARRQVSPRRLVAPGPDQAALARIVGAAAHAPDHGQLRPWRFVLVPAAKRGDLGAVFAAARVARDPGCDEDARAAAYGKAFHAPCLLAAILDDDPAFAISTTEKLVSLGCAIHCVLLAAKALALDSGLVSGAAMQDPGMRDLLRLAPHEQAICFIALGTADSVRPPRRRPTLAEFLSTL